MKKILLSLMTIGAVSALIFGATAAYFNETEKSSGNTFAADSVDLKIQNHSYYNGEIFENTSWEFNDITDQLFFSFPTLSPGDWGEDTVSLKIVDSDAWLCAKVMITENSENGLLGPELALGDNEQQGELASGLEFIWWADDGDNVLETDEKIISQSYLSQAVLDQPIEITLADSQTSIWGSGPLQKNQAYEIGKAWCFGKLIINAVAAGAGQNPTVDPGIFCDGRQIDNTYQSDSVKLDISFRAHQAENNPGYLCFISDDQECTTGQTRQCSTGLPGACAPGRQQCLSGFWNECAPLNYHPEICGNGLDDDCDGLDEATDPECKFGCQSITDTMLVLDRSAAMKITEIELLKKQASDLVEKLNLSAAGNHAGIVLFSNSAYVENHLTANKDVLLDSIRRLYLYGRTNFEQGIIAATAELANTNLPYERPLIPDFMIIIADNDASNLNNRPYAMYLAKLYADAAKQAGIAIYVIGLGSGLNSYFLASSVASSPDKYYALNNENQISEITGKILSCQ